VGADGRVACWGSDEFGQSSPPHKRFVQVVAGQFHTCGLQLDGTAFCCGNNTNGQLDAHADKFEPLTASASYMCGLRTEGSGKLLECGGGTRSHLAGLSYDRSRELTGGE